MNKDIREELIIAKKAWEKAKKEADRQQTINDAWDFRHVEGYEKRKNNPTLLQEWKDGYKGTKESNEHTLKALRALEERAKDRFDELVEDSPQDIVSIFFKSEEINNTSKFLFDKAKPLPFDDDYHLPKSELAKWKNTQGIRIHGSLDPIASIAIENDSESLLKSLAIKRNDDGSYNAAELWRQLIYNGIMNPHKRHYTGEEVAKQLKR